MNASLSYLNVEKFHKRGFVVIPSFIDDHILKSMREESLVCLRILTGMAPNHMEKSDSSLDLHSKGLSRSKLESCGCVIEPLSLCFPSEDVPTKLKSEIDPVRSFIKMRGEIFNDTLVSSFICGEKMIELITLLFKSPEITPSIQIINEQYILKPPNSSNSAFPYHQDREYLEEEDKKSLGLYVSCWIALDEMTEENGALYVVPYEKDEESTEEGFLEKHKRKGNLYQEKEFYQNNWEENLEDEKEIPLSIPSGSMIILSSHVLHRSGNNISNQFRRAYMPQYLVRFDELENSGSSNSKSLLPPFPKKENIL
eukprot:TRINITY_DN5060_c0_g1_i1.p1 TRINITY_DN5060_c0_g1~~TRINITY_DN5060_c0_g1_i1.p1  ORF type:complete len:312 (+),score=101.53 TRINITY_DN5060_c0_g1_i1:32-967(+)